MLQNVNDHLSNHITKLYSVRKCLVLLNKLIVYIQIRSNQSYIDKLFRVAKMLGFDLNSAATLQRFRNEFEVGGKIGSGGFSTVYRVKNKRDLKQFALKIVKIKPSQTKAELADTLQKVLSQGKLLSSLNHPNILRYCGSWIDGDLDEEYFEAPSATSDDQPDFEMLEVDLDSGSIVFESSSKPSQKIKESKIAKPLKQFDKSSDNFFGTNLRKYKQLRVCFLCQLAEHSLQKHVQARNQKAHKTAQQKKRIMIENYRIILDVIQGLNYIHSQKIIHRDIKLHNIVYGKDGKFKIIDLGLAKRVRGQNSLRSRKYTFDGFSSQEDAQQHSSRIGTKFYCSPEQTHTNSYDHRTDIYSLAMVAGILFSDHTTTHEQNDILSNMKNRKFDDFDMDERLKDMLKKCLREEKYRPNLKELKACIKKLLREAMMEGQNRQYIKNDKFCYLRKGNRLVKRIPLQQWSQFNENQLQAEENQNKQEEISVKS